MMIIFLTITFGRFCIKNSGKPLGSLHQKRELLSLSNPITVQNCNKLNCYLKVAISASLFGFVSLHLSDVV